MAKQIQTERKKWHVEQGLFLEYPKLLAAIGENNVPVYLRSVRTRKDVTGPGNTKRKLPSGTQKVQKVHVNNT